MIPHYTAHYTLVLIVQHGHMHNSMFIHKMSSILLNCIIFVIFIPDPLCSNGTAVLVYMKDHYPTTPDEYNFQAELKAASHWYWYPKSNKNPGHEEEDCTSIKLPELASGPHKDNRVKIAAMETCKKWISDLKQLKMESSPHMRSQRVKEDEESSPDEDEHEERIYGV